MTSYISDMLTRISNGQKANLGEVLLHTATPEKCLKILTILEKEGYIFGWEEWNFKNEKVQNTSKALKARIKVLLKYNGHGKMAIRGVFTVSKPGRKVFLSSKALWKPKSRTGIFILSTPIGILTDKEARYFNVGGEILCGIF